MLCSLEVAVCFLEIIKTESSRIDLWLQVIDLKRGVHILKLLPASNHNSSHISHHRSMIKASILDSARSGTNNSNLPIDDHGIIGLLQCVRSTDLDYKVSSTSTTL